MSILSNHLFIYLALIALVVLVNIIIFLMCDGGRLFPSAELATRPVTAKQNIETSEGAFCDCRCHSERGAMFPGMRCIDCFGQLCDEGTVTIQEREPKS